MPAEWSRQGVVDAIVGWRGAEPGIRSCLLQACCTGIGLRSLISNSVTLLLVAAVIIAETGKAAHVLWLTLVILGGVLPRAYAAQLRRQGHFDQDTDRKALRLVAISAVYGGIWGAGPLVILPDIQGLSVGVLLIMMVFGTIMGPYAALPGVLYARMATTGIPTLTAITLYTSPRLTFVCCVLAAWLILRTDVWRGYHRTLRRQFELHRALEQRQEELTSAGLAREEAMATLRVMADTDPLTGAANRRQLLAHLRALQGPAALVLFDIDCFKAINDSYGHQAGDAVLVDLAGLVQRVMRREDVLARLGGDEFAVVLPGVDPETAWAIAERLREFAEEHVIQAGEQSVSVTISVGLAMVRPGRAVDPSALMREADAALYAAKRQGRNRTLVYGAQPG
jgi:diguanylate cyclase (GGDEF)-like protein